MIFFKKKKVEKKKKEPKYNCKKDGHLFKIVCFNAMYCDNNDRPDSPIFMAECEVCRERKTSEGKFWTCLPYWWEKNLISFETYQILYKETNRHQAKIQKLFDDNLKVNKKREKK